MDNLVLIITKTMSNLFMAYSILIPLIFAYIFFFPTYISLWGHVSLFPDLIIPICIP